MVFVDDGVDVDAVDGDVEGSSPLEGAVASSVAGDPPSAPSADVPPPDDGVDRRSFLAQPEPLKWKAGALIAFRTGPDPHRGHAAGGSSCTPWIASNRRAHAEQS